LCHGGADREKTIGPLSEGGVIMTSQESTVEDAEAVEASGVENIETGATLDPELLRELDARSLSEIDSAPPGEVLSRDDIGTLAASRGQITPHFKLEEFHCHDGTHVPSAALPGLLRLCREVLEPLRAKFGVCRVNSGYRTAAYNKKIGGAPNSQHIYDIEPASVAADVRLASGTPAQWAAEADRLLAGRGGVGRYSSFVHVDNRPNRARWVG
jgi:hypothetical protein